MKGDKIVIYVPRVLSGCFCPEGDDRGDDLTKPESLIVTYHKKNIIFNVVVTNSVAYL